ncbi:unnamed protein product [Vicia faba]|uniref:Albumin-2 n=1 Tax=Vicia faba TaxID=3906 RepID=A0AAV1AHW1_VICFA|nr:unnamed protein product [Vicia faba]
MPYHNIDAAFRSSKVNECYLFVKDKYVVLNYAPGEKKKDIIKGPCLISDGFPMVAKMSAENVIDCAFNTHHNEAFFFFEKQCEKIDYAPDSTKSELLSGPTSIIEAFPCLDHTVHKDGIDAAFLSTRKNVYLFKGHRYTRIDYVHPDYAIIVYRTIRKGFGSLLGTVFESGIDAAFSSHVKHEAYIFRGEYYARINFGPDTLDGDFIVGGRIKRIKDDWPALHDILHYE